MIICAHPNCSMALAKTNRSGFCRNHRPERHRITETVEKRIVEKPLAVAGYSMAEGLTMQVSLPREPWREE